MSLPSIQCRKRTENYYQTLYWANKRNIAWQALKRTKKKKYLIEFIIAYQNYKAMKSANK